MYSIGIAAAVLVLAGAVVYEIRRQKQTWNRFQESLDKLKSARVEACTS